jgi:hypothetical protein
MFIVGMAVRALRFGAALPLVWHWDDIRFAEPGRNILGGALPVQVVGVGYVGATFSYLLAPWFWLAGATTAVMDLVVYAHGMVMMATGYLVARRLVGPRAALFALAVLAVPPLYLAQWSVNGTVGHPQALLFGNLILLGVHTAFFRQREPHPRTLFGIGLLIGVGWWTNPGIAIYVLPLGLLALRTGLVWRPRIGLVVLGTILGGLPQWLYELRYFPSARFALMRAGSEAPSTLPDRVRLIFGTFLYQLLGVDPHLPVAVLVLGAVVVLLPWAAAILRAFGRDRGELAWLVGLGGRRATGASILWVVAAANLGLILVTSRQISAWYLFFLYSALPCWLGAFLAELATRRRWLAGVALSGFLLFNLGTSWADTLGRVLPRERRWAPLLAEVTPAFAQLEARGHRRLYWHEADWPPYELTFLSGGRLAASDLWRDEHVANGDLVDAEIRPAIMWAEGATQAKALRESLAGVGQTVRESRLGHRLLLEAAPTFAHGFEQLLPAGWTVTASDHMEWAARLVDRDATTGWATASSMAPGQWIAVDLGREETVARVDLLSLDWQDVPIGYRVELSRDGTTWHEAVSVPDYWGPLFFSEQHAFLKVRRGRVQAIFPPDRARFVRMVQTGTDDRNPWAARELYVYRPSRPRPEPPADGALADALAREGVWFAYANHWLTARVLAESRGQIGGLETNLFRNAYGGYTEPPPARVGPSRLQRGVGVLVGSDSDAEAIRDTLRGQRLTWRETTAGPYPLFVVTGRSARRRPLSRDGWRATADEHAEEAARAIDGQVATMWSPATAEGRLTVDLGRRLRVSGVEIAGANPVGAHRDFRLWGSGDGQTWTPLGPVRWAGRVYWDGAEFLRLGRGEWRVDVPEAAIRYLRVAAAGSEPAGWSVAEIRCFE